MVPPSGLPTRLFWFVLIWATSVAGLGVVGVAIKALLR